jgi:hypothetical protein
MDDKVKNFYDMVPRKKWPSEARPDGTVDVLLPRYGNNAAGRLLKMILSKAPVRVKLDGVGTSVWNLCDGRRSVQDIGTSLHREFGEGIEPVYERLEQFLAQMLKADLIEWTSLRS